MIQRKKAPGKEIAPDLMSAEELKMRLQQHFAKSGTLNNLKTQLRNQLVTELFKVAELPTSKIGNDISDTEAKKTLLPLQVSNWLVYDHLKRQRYDYSLSTFVTEAGVSFPEKHLSLSDILDLLGLKSESEESEIITRHYVHCKQGSFLHSLLSCVMKQHAEFHLQDSKRKENTTPEENLDVIKDANILRHPQQHFLKDNWTKPQNHLVESTNLMGESLNNDLQMYHHKFYQEMQSEKEEHEKEVQRLRQKLLNELDRLYEHEQQVRLELEQRKSRLTREQEHLDVEKSKLRAKQLELAKRLSHVETESEKVRLAKEESMSSSLMEKEEFIGRLESKLKQQEQKLSEERLMLSNQKIEIEDLRNQLQQMENNSRSVQDKYSALLEENAFLMRKLEGENTDGSSGIKTELKSSLKEVENCKIRIKQIEEKAEAEKTVILNAMQSLEEQLKMRLQKVPDMMDVCVSTEGSHFLDESVWNQQRDKLEQELGETKQLYHEVLQRLQEQNEDIQDLHLTVHVLHDEISNQTKPVVEAGDKTSYPAEPASFPSPVAPVRPNQVIRTSGPPTHQSLNHFLPNAPYPGLYYPLPEFQRTIKDDPCKFISEAKKRISDLEKEALTVKKKYSNFVATRASLSHQDFFPYGSTVRNSDVHYPPNQNYDTLSYKVGTSALEETDFTVQGSYDHILPFTGYPYFGTSHSEDSGGEKSQISFPHNEVLSRNIAGSVASASVNHHVKFLDEKSISHKSTFGASNVQCGEQVISSQISSVQELSTCQNNEKFGLKSHVQATTSHKHPICFDSTSGMLVPCTTNEPQFSAQHHDNSVHNHSLAFPVHTANVNTSAPYASVSSEDDHPFHLSKFGLNGVTSKSIPSSSLITSDQILLHSCDSEGQKENYIRRKSDASVLGNKDSHITHSSNIKEKDLVETSKKSDCFPGKGETCSFTSSQNLKNELKHLATTSATDTRTHVSSHSPKHVDQSKDSILSKEDESNKDDDVTQNGKEVASFRISLLKSSENVDSDVDVNTSNQVKSEMLNQHLETSQDDICEKITGTKPKSGVAFRRLSVDLDSLWKQNSASTSSTVKSFPLPHSGNSHILPSKFDRNEAATAVKLEPFVKTDFKNDDIVRKTISCNKPDCVLETDSENNLAKRKNDSLGSDSNANVSTNDDKKTCQVSNNLTSSRESLSENRSDLVDVQTVKGLDEEHVSIADPNPMYHSEPCEAAEVEQQAEFGTDFHIVKDVVAKHDSSENSEMPKSLAHTSPQSEEINKPCQRSSDVPHTVADMESFSSVAVVENDTSKLNMGFVDKGLVPDQNLDLDIGAEIVSVVPIPDETDKHQPGDKRSGDEDCPLRDSVCEERPAEGGSNTYSEDALDKSISELSELNLSAGNEEFEQSKGEESDW